MIKDCIIKDFLNGMQKVYHKAKKSSLKNFDNRIVRGRARCVAVDFEDRLADFICKNIIKENEESLLVLTDFPVTIMPGLSNEEKKNRETRYIDIIVCREKSDEEYDILYMAELKTNTGWMRNQSETCLTKNESLIRHLKERSTMVSSRPESMNKSKIKVKRCVFNISPKLKYDMIVLSSTNNGKNKLCEQRKNELCRLIVLTDDSLVGKSKVEPRYSDFNDLYARIRRSICCK